MNLIIRFIYHASTTLTRSLTHSVTCPACNCWSHDVCHESNDDDCLLQRKRERERECCRNALLCIASRWRRFCYWRVRYNINDDSANMWWVTSIRCEEILPEKDIYFLQGMQLDIKKCRKLFLYDLLGQTVCFVSVLYPLRYIWIFLYRPAELI